MKAAFTCSYGLPDRRSAMEMNFPHEQPLGGNSVAVSLRRLDMDILRVLSAQPVAARPARAVASADPAERHACLMNLFARRGHADRVARGSFNPHVANALACLTDVEQQGEDGVYHYASGNRKVARLLRSQAELNNSQAF